MRSLKVLFVTPFFEPSWTYGGIVRAASEWAHALSLDSSIATDIISTTANVPAELEVPIDTCITIDKLNVRYFKRYRWTGTRYVSVQQTVHMINHLRRYDLVHIIGLWTFGSLIASRLCTVYHIPYVVSLHGMLMPWALEHHPIRKRVFLSLIEANTIRKARGILCSTDMEKCHLLNLNLVREDKIKVISNITGSARFDIRESRLRFRTRFHLADSKALIFSGRLVENKGLHLSLSAFAGIIGEYPNSRFFIVGPEEGGFFAKLKRLMTQFAIEDKVHYLGMLTGQDYFDALAGSDLCVLHSYSENFGNVVTEALSVGTPVLISDRVGVKDLVIKYGAGMVTPLEIDKITEAMRYLLSNSEKLAEMGQRGIELVNKNCTHEVVGEQLSEYFRESALKN